MRYFVQIFGVLIQLLGPWSIFIFFSDALLLPPYTHSENSHTKINMGLKSIIISGFVLETCSPALHVLILWPETKAASGFIHLFILKLSKIPKLHFSH